MNSSRSRWISSMVTQNDLETRYKRLMRLER